MSEYTEVKNVGSNGSATSVKNYTIPSSPGNKMDVDSVEFRNKVTARDKAIIEFMGLCGIDDCVAINDENGFMTDLLVDGKYVLAVRHSNAYVQIANSRVALGKTSDGVQYQKSQLSKGKAIKVKNHTRRIGMIVDIAKKDYNRNKQFNDFKLSVESVTLPDTFTNPMTGSMPAITASQLGVVSFSWEDSDENYLTLDVAVDGNVVIKQSPIGVEGVYDGTDIDSLDRIPETVDDYIGWVRQTTINLKPIVSELK